MPKKDKAKAKGKARKKAADKAHQGQKAKSKAGRKPKKKCCVSKPRCSRCPLRMLAEGTLPEGYTVKRRRLVKVDGKDAKDRRPKAA